MSGTRTQAVSMHVGDGETGIGCSPYTLDVKLKQFPALFAKFLAIYLNLIRRRGGEIVVLDLTAGGGVYDYMGRTVRGMVVQALEALDGVKVPWRLCAIESKRANYDSLCAAVSRPFGRVIGPDQVLLLRGDNAVLAPAFLDSLRPRYRCMLLIYDWNGVADLDLVARLLEHQRAKYADALGHIQAVALKRWLAVRSGPIQPTDRRKLHERLDALPRSRQLLRRIHGNPQWTFVISTNAPNIGSLVRLGFHERGTPEGEWLREVLSFSEEDLAAGQGLAGSGRPVQIALPLGMGGAARGR